jgi:hypothetical protein
LLTPGRASGPSGRFLDASILFLEIQSKRRPCNRFRLRAGLRQIPPCGAGRQSIAELLFGFEDLDLSEQLRDIQARLEGLDSRIANYVMALMHAIADEAKHGPRLFTIEPVRPALSDLVSGRYQLQLWCEAEGCQHPVLDEGVGVYGFRK